MSGKELSGTETVGCLMSIWQLLITGPIWLILLFQVLTALGDAIPSWSWVLYWIYVPACVLGVISGAFGKLLMERK